MQALLDQIHPDSRITVLTGAGVSAASGVPAFRGTDGLWRNFRPEALATAEAFGRDPRLVWEWYAWRRVLIAACEPNDAHRVLADWSQRFPNFRLITQNVDGLHEAAFANEIARSASVEASTVAKATVDGPAGQALDAPGVIRLHGSIWEVSCWSGCVNSPKRWRDDRLAFEVMPPRCPHCQGLIRPGVVWFGETLEADVITQASNAARCDVFITVGTSALVYPAAGLVEQAKQHGAFTVEINLESTPATRTVDLAIQGGAETILPEIDRLIRGQSVAV